MSNPWSTIYRKNIWAGVESVSGPGSGTAATRLVGPAITALVSWVGVRTVIDLGCGDGFWMPDVGAAYLGIDVAPEAVRASRERHPERLYVVGDIRTLDAQADLIIVRDVIQHLVLADAMDLVSKVRERCRYLLASTYQGGSNTGIGRAELLRGRAFDNDLEAGPFWLGPPMQVIPDGYGYEGESVRDERKVLGLWQYG